MNLHDDPGALFRDHMPDTTPPPAAFDLDKIVRDGYKARRRHRAVLGGAVTSGVAAVAVMLALSVAGLPGKGPETGPADEDGISPAETPVVDDPTTAGYPYEENWGMVLNEMDQVREGEELLRVKEVATAAFGPLLADAGVWDSPANLSDEEECNWVFEDPSFSEELAQQEYDDCMVSQSGMGVGAEQSPGNYAQTYLRSYIGGESEEDGLSMRTVFSFELALPGGWTAEPGPITEQLFPQHLISDGPYFTADAPEFTTERLDDGRTLMVADHGCAAEVAVVYPNGTGLRASWNDCTGTDYPLDLEGLKAAALSMPEQDLDTTGLAPVGDLVDVPMGYYYDNDAWMSSEEAEADATATYDAARDAIQDLYPEATLSGGGAFSLGLMDRGAEMRRSYSANGELPFETTIDESVGNISFDLRYYLPGGWIPGFSDTGHWDPHLTVCKEDFECSLVDGEDGTQFAVEESTVEHTPESDGDPEGTWDPYTEHEFYVTRYSPEGWAVGVRLNWQGDAPIDADMLMELLSALPAPVFDAEDVPVLPAG